MTSTKTSLYPFRFTIRHESGAVAEWIRFYSCFGEAVRDRHALEAREDVQVLSIGQAR